MGPNDIGILRGIIGDGQSMNDEDIKAKAIGKPKVLDRKDFMSMPVDKKFLVNQQVKSFNTTSLDYMLGKNKINANNYNTFSPVDKMNNMIGKGSRQTQNFNTFNAVDKMNNMIGKGKSTQNITFNAVDKMNNMLGKSKINILQYNKLSQIMGQTNSVNPINKLSYFMGRTQQQTKFNTQRFVSGKNIRKDKHGKNLKWEEMGQPIDTPPTDTVDMPSVNISNKQDDKGYTTMSKSMKWDKNTAEPQLRKLGQNPVTDVPAEKRFQSVYPESSMPEKSVNINRIGQELATGKQEVDAINALSYDTSTDYSNIKPYNVKTPTQTTDTGGYTTMGAINASNTARKIGEALGGGSSENQEAATNDRALKALQKYNKRIAGGMSQEEALKKYNATLAETDSRGVKGAFDQAWDGTSQKKALFSASAIGNKLGFGTDTEGNKGKGKEIFDNAKMVVGAVKTGFYGTQKELTPQEQERQKRNKAIKRANYKEGWQNIVGFSSGMSPRQKGEKAKNWASGLANNLGTSISSNTIVGPFEQKSLLQNVRMAQMALDGYKQSLAKKHTPEGMKKEKRFLSFDQVLPSLTINEKIKVNQLTNAVTNAQRTSASGGFMGSGSGVNIIGSSSPSPQFRKFTQVGTSAQQEFGMSGPETRGRLGVNQGLRAMPTTKWGALLPNQLGQESSKISMILGKAPDPQGINENASAKIKRLSGI
jgi:hypothetical protein